MTPPRPAGQTVPEPTLPEQFTGNALPARSIQAAREKLERLSDESKPVPPMRAETQKAADVKVSIIVPIFDVEKYLERSLQSLVGQTLKGLEIILIDDGSQDASGKIADEWKKRDPRIQVIHQKNHGSGSARNAGIGIATGEYIGFADPDDWVSENYFEGLYDAAERRGADVAATNGVVVWNEDDGSQRGKETGFKAEGEIAWIEDRARILWFTGIAWNKIYRRAFIEKHAIRFSEIHCTGQDNLFTFMAVARANFIATTTRGKYFYRIHSGSSTKSPRTRKHLQIVDIYAEIRGELAASGLGDDYADVLRERMLSDFSRQSRGMDPEARKEFLVRANEMFGDWNIARHLDPSGNELIVSLTSYPPRIGTAHQAIETLLRQTKKPDRLILWLAESEFPGKESDLPPELMNLIPRGLTIEWCENIKSYKKIIPALKKYPDALICIADDDNLYAGDWLQKLYDSHLKSPNAINGARMRRIGLSERGDIQPYCRWTLSAHDHPSFLNVLTGVGGALYPPGAFHEDVLREDLFMTLAPHADDLWLWAMAVLNDRKIKATDDHDFIAHLIDGSQECALWDANCLDGENDEQLEAILDHYPRLVEKLREAQAEEFPGSQAQSPASTHPWESAERNVWRGIKVRGDEGLVGALAEVQHLHTLLETQGWLRRLETQNTLGARLGKLLIHAAEAGAWFSLPGQIGKIWRETKRTPPPATLGAGFEKLFAVYERGGFPAVEHLLAEVSLPPLLQSNGYTALARRLLGEHRNEAAEAARRAFELDPQPYRQKWLAFRFRDAGKLAEADALLELLPADTPFSESESRQSRQLRHEAKWERRRQAREKTGTPGRADGDKPDEERTTMGKELTELFRLEKAGRYKEALDRIHEQREAVPALPPVRKFNLDLLEERLRARLVGVPQARSEAEIRPQTEAIPGLSELFALEKAGRYREALDRIHEQRKATPELPSVRQFNLDLLEERLRFRLRPETPIATTPQ
jgi:glycosyltransferase involved in cell wall biosynthesis